MFYAKTYIFRYFLYKMLESKKKIHRLPDDKNIQKTMDFMIFVSLSSGWLALDTASGNTGNDLL